MISANTPTHKRARRRGRKRERFLGEAILLAVLTTIVMTILLAVVLALIPHTALRDIWDLYKGQVPISPQSLVFQDILQKEQQEQNYFVAPVAFLIGGLVFGMTAPRRLGRNKTVLIGAMIALVFNLLLLAVALGLAYHGNSQVTNTNAKQIRDFARQQAIADLGWSLCGMAGAFLGNWKRRAPEDREAA